MTTIPAGRPLAHFELTMSSAATGLSDPFQVLGKGVTTGLATIPDTTSAAGTLYACIADAKEDFAAAKYKVLPVPVLTKAAGAALTAEPLEVDKPGPCWMCYRYVRASGGAADEITIDVTVY